MRATSNVVVFSSLLIASVAIAGPDQKTPPKTPVAKPTNAVANTIA